MDVPDFIQSVLVDRLRALEHGEGHPILSLSFLCQGVEFLGACLDAEPFSAKGLEAPRFRRAIDDLFPPLYRRFNQGTGKLFDLYENLRAAFLLPIIPESRLEIVRRDAGQERNAHHLEVVEIRGLSRLSLVWEDLVDDYEEACREVMVRIHQGRLKGWKFEGV